MRLRLAVPCNCSRHATYWRMCKCCITYLLTERSDTRTYFQRLTNPSVFSTRSPSNLSDLEGHVGFVGSEGQIGCYHHHYFNAIWRMSIFSKFSCSLLNVCICNKYNNKKFLLFDNVTYPQRLPSWGQKRRRLRGFRISRKLVKATPTTVGRWTWQDSVSRATHRRRSGLERGQQRRRLWGVWISRKLVKATPTSVGQGTL